MTPLVAVLAAGFAAGGCLVASGWTKSIPTPAQDRTLSRSRRTDVRRRMVLAAVLGSSVAMITRWPVAALALGAFGWFTPDLFGSKAARQQATAKTEGIASWTEMLRDTISGAHGLEEAVMTTATVAPAAIRREVTDLAVRLERQPLEFALRSFANDLAHPLATSLSLR